MKFLILGGNGYLGGRVIERLLKEFEDAFIVVTTRGIADLKYKDRKNIQYISTSTETIDAIMNMYAFDMVLNFSCCYGRESLLENNICEANIVFPLSVLNLSVKHNIQKFLTIDTALPDRLNMYTYTKATFREFGRFYCENHNIDFCNLELQMFYSPDEPLDRFIPGITADMLKGNRVLTTEGTQKRDIISVDDVVNAVICIIKYGLKGYNNIPVGTGVAPTISELIDFIWEETGKKSEVQKGAVPMRAFEPDCVSDTSVISGLCDWKPVFWKDGIKDMIKGISGRLKENK